MTKASLQTANYLGTKQISGTVLNVWTGIVIVTTNEIFMKYFALEI
jgi:hypothetical protein